MELVTQTLPELSTARTDGPDKPPPVKPLAGEMGAPLEPFNSVTLSPKLSATQTSPERSTAMPNGTSKPPPLKPVLGDIGWPLTPFNSVTLSPKLFATQML